MTSQPIYPQPTSSCILGKKVGWGRWSAVAQKSVSRFLRHLIVLEKKDFERGAMISLYNITIEISYLKNETMCRDSIAASVCPFVSILTTLQVIVDRANAETSRNIHIWMLDSISPLRTKYIQYI